MKEGEISSKYFLSLEKKRQNHNVIKELRTDKGQIIHSDKDILKEANKFYSDLYTSSKTSISDINAYFEKTPETYVLSNKEKLACDEKLSTMEITEAVTKLNKNKSPGPDGLTPEFYQKFWDYLKKPFMEMLDETYKYKQLPSSVSNAILTLIHKKDEKELLKNYRPISLNNYDYKIISFALSSRLQKVISKIVSTDQSAYIKKRYIGFTARYLLDINNYCETNKISGILLTLDFKKAFDTLEWNFMSKTLNKFGFGEYFKSWVNILYTEPTITIKNNGWLSRKLTMKRGIRQGCPLSALLFIIATEILSINLKSNENIRGIKIGKYESTICQYADDTTLTLGNKNSIHHALKSIDDFSRVAGLQLNIQKCVGLWLGPLKKGPAYFENVAFTNDPIRCLGIYLGTDSQKCIAKSWEEQLSKFRHILLSWHNRKLTFYGKSIIINLLALPKLTYILTILPTPDDFLKTIEREIFTFLWGKNRFPIKRNTAIGTHDLGGLNVVDIFSKEKSLKASWIPKLLDNDNKCCIILDYFLQKKNFNYEILLKTNFRKKTQCDVALQLPDFYCNLLLAFNHCKYIKPTYKLTNMELLTQCIWGNEYFKSQGKTLFLINWIKSGFIYVKDLLDKDGMWLSEQELISKLQKKNNWIAELMIIKKAVGKYLQNKDFSNCKYIQDRRLNRLIFTTRLKTYNISEDNCNAKFFYTILRDKKFERPFSEKMWEKELNLTIQNHEWTNIYKNITNSIKYRKYSEFKFKILHNILPCGKLISKWNKTKSRYCDYCKETENIPHLLYECTRIKNLWLQLSGILQIDIKLKHIILSLQNISIQNEIKNIVIVMVLYAIYSTWVKCSFENICYSTINLNHIIKEYIILYCNTFSLTYEDLCKKTMLRIYKERICKSM